MVSQSTLSNKMFGPEKALDKYMNTRAHTICQDGKKVWYEIKFHREHAVNQVVMFNLYNFFYKSRMDGTKVAVLSREEEHTCETLSVTAEDDIEKYSINCNNLRGDRVILRGEGKEKACNHIREIQVFETLDLGMVSLIWQGLLILLSNMSLSCNTESYVENQRRLYHDTSDLLIQVQFGLT